jgi:hypothetical protein
MKLIVVAGNRSECEAYASAQGIQEKQLVCAVSEADLASYPRAPVVRTGNWESNPLAQNALLCAFERFQGGHSRAAVASRGSLRA